MLLIDAVCGKFRAAAAQHAWMLTPGTLLTVAALICHPDPEADMQPG